MDWKYLKNIGVYVLSAVLSILLIAYIVFQAFGGFKSKIEVMVADKYTENDIMTLEAYVMRNEIILYSVYQGGINYLYPDGAKVGMNTVVANVYSGDNVLTDRSYLIELDNQISILESSNITDTLSIKDTTAVDSRISDLYELMCYRLSYGDINFVMHKKDDLLVLLNRRAIITKKIPNYNDKIKLLQDEKLSLSTGNENIIDTITTENSGYFYTEADGFEIMFASTKAANLTVPQFKNMINSTPDTYTRNNIYGIGKIVVDYNWYIACVVTKDELRHFKENNKYDVIFTYSNDVKLNMRLERIIQDPVDPSIILLFSTGRVLENFNFLRKQSIEIVRSSYTGYRVPISAVRQNKEGRDGVYILDGNIVKFKEISVLIESNGYYIVEAQDKMNDEEYYKKLGLYDLIITKGTKLYEGKVVD